MGTGLRGRGLGMGEKLKSLEAGLRELAPRGAGLQPPRDLQFRLATAAAVTSTLVAPRPCGESGGQLPAQTWHGAGPASLSLCGA